MKVLLFLFLTSLLLVIAFNCTTEPQPDDNFKLELILEDISCTEAWLQLNTEGLQLPAEINIKRTDADGNSQSQISLLTTQDSLFYIDSLLPNKTYSFEASLQTSNLSTLSSQTTVTTMDTTNHNFTWEIDTIGTFQSALYDVWGIDENNVYAVGLVFLSITPYKATSIMHWNGTDWSPIDYLEGILLSVYGFSANDIWVCGYWQVDNNGYALISHWNGNEWQTWKFNQYPSLYSIWGISSQNMYAVGNNGNILNYDGVSWKQIPTGISENLYEIYGISDNEIYAAGNSYPDFKGIVLKFDGTSWKKQTSCLSGNDVCNISSLWGSKSDRFYVGTYKGYDTAWKTFGWPNDNTFIDEIRGSGENNIFAVGSFNLIMHYNGSSFKRYHFYKKPDGGRLYGIYAEENFVFIIGGENAKGIVYRGIQ